MIDNKVKLPDSSNEINKSNDKEEVTMLEQKSPVKLQHNLPCDVCEIQCFSKTSMDNHNVDFHGEDGDFTCDYCSFQGNSKKTLSNHMESAHDIKCHNCEEHFKSKTDLMHHRKSSHLDKINVCKYFVNGNCKFGAECWYKHSPEGTPRVQSEEQNFKCNSCGEMFKSRTMLMRHRKNVHINTITKCREYIKGNCSRTNENCWYLHEEANMMMDTSEGFPEVMEGTIPPEKNMVNLIKIILSKIELLINYSHYLLY